MRSVAVALVLLGALSVGPVFAAGVDAAASTAPRRPAWLGVAMTPSPAGVLVRHVVRGSPAAQGGMRDGDTIRAIDGARVGSPEEVSRIVSQHSPGEALVATVARGGEAVSLRIALAGRPSGDDVLRMDRIGEFAPAWVGVTPVGDAPTSVASLRGSVVLLDFWATWCGPCRLLAPKLSALQARYGAQGLRVVGVTTDPAEKAAVAAERIGAHYPISIDASGETSRAYSISALPTLFVIDKRGVVRDLVVGYDPDSDARIDALLGRLLAE